MYNEQPSISKWVADMYDLNETDTDDVAFLLSVVSGSPKRILEVCCGSGRILVPLAQAGHTVSGFDADAYMLAKIQAKAQGLDNIAWRKADAVYDEWGSGYDIVVLAGNILFNIVSDMDYEKSQAIFIQKAADALAPGGHIYIDYQYFMHPERVFGSSGENIIWEGHDADGNWGRMILLGGNYDALTGIDTSTRRFELTLKSGEAISQDIPSLKHFATLEQIHNWLGVAGCAVEWEYGDYQRNPISATTRRAIIWARKG